MGGRGCNTLPSDRLRPPDPLTLAFASIPAVYTASAENVSAPSCDSTTQRLSSLSIWSEHACICWACYVRYVCTAMFVALPPPLARLRMCLHRCCKFCLCSWHDGCIVKLAVAAGLSPSPDRWTGRVRQPLSPLSSLVLLPFCTLSLYHSIYLSITVPPSLCHSITLISGYQHRSLKLYGAPVRACANSGRLQ